MKGKPWILLPHRKERGQALVETALVVGLLLLLVLGVVDFGRAMNNYIIITNAAREGARYGSHFPHHAIGIREAVKQEAADNGITLQDSDISIDPDPDAGPPAPSGGTIWVGVEYSFDTIMGAMIGLDPLTLRSATIMRVFGLDT